MQYWFARSDRERLILGIGGAVVLAGLVFLTVVEPLLARLDRATLQVVRKERQIREVGVLGVEYAAKRMNLETLERRMAPAGAPVSLLALLEEAAVKAHVRDRISSMQPQSQTEVQGYRETVVDLRLEGVELPQLLALLATFDAASYAIQVRHLQIKPRYDHPTHLDAMVRVLAHAKTG